MDALREKYTARLYADDAGVGEVAVVFEELMGKTGNGDVETLGVEQDPLCHRCGLSGKVNPNLGVVHVETEERDGHEHEEDDDACDDEHQFFHSGKNTTRRRTDNLRCAQKKTPWW